MSRIRREPGEDEIAEVTVRKVCQGCFAEFRLWIDLIPCSDDKMRCAGCHMAFLKAHASLPTDLCAVCEIPLREHIAECKRLGSLIGSEGNLRRLAARPSLLEASGVHPPRGGKKSRPGVTEGRL